MRQPILTEEYIHKNKKGKEAEAEAEAEGEAEEKVLFFNYYSIFH